MSMSLNDSTMSSRYSSTQKPFPQKALTRTKPTPKPKPPTPAKKPTHSAPPVGKIKIAVENPGNLPNIAD